MDYNIIKEYRGKHSRKLGVIETEFGKVKIDFLNIKKGHKLTIQSALNKNEYYQRQLNKKYGENKVTLISDYINTNVKVLVNIDNIEYLIFPKNLLKVLPNILSSTNKTKYFINEAIKIHGDKYDYSKTKYTSLNTKIKIICKYHGDFFQIVKSHLKGSGCPICGQSDAVKKRLTFTKGVKNAIVYCLEIIDTDNTTFYKIGFTRHSVKFRYMERENLKNSRMKMPYQYKIIFELVYKYEEAIKIENKLHKFLSMYHYKPKIKFDGSATECFTQITNYDTVI